MADKDSDPSAPEVPFIQKMVSVFWPSFITSVLATVGFFLIFDPVELFRTAGVEDISPLGIYTISFFMFWALTGISCFFTTCFLRPCHTLNQPRK